MRASKNREGDREYERVDFRKKHRALKTGRIEEDIALDRHFKPITIPLRQIVHSPGVRAIKRELRHNDAASVTKRERKEEEEEQEEKKDEKNSITFESSATLHKFDDRSHEHVQSIIPTSLTKIQPRVRERFRNDDLLATKVQNRLLVGRSRGIASRLELSSNSLKSMSRLFCGEFSTRKRERCR